jgi:hypothetical protein
MVKLARRKGYRLVGANRLGFNFIFLRNDEGEGVLPEVTIDDVLQHPTAQYHEVDPVVFTYPFISE